MMTAQYEPIPLLGFNVEIVLVLLLLLLSPCFFFLFIGYVFVYSQVDVVTLQRRCLTTPRTNSRLLNVIFNPLIGPLFPVQFENLFPPPAALPNLFAFVSRGMSLAISTRRAPG